MRKENLPVCCLVSPTSFENPLIVVTPAQVAMMTTTPVTTTTSSTSEEELVALDRGKAFVWPPSTKAMEEMEKTGEIPDSNGMRVQPQVVQLMLGNAADIVIRSITEALLARMPQSGRYRREKIPCVRKWERLGFGKTTSTAFLMGMLFKKKKTVVYRIKSEPFFWEFGHDTVTGGYHVKVYPEKDDTGRVKCLFDDSTYYILDYGKDKEASCLPRDSLAGPDNHRVIFPTRDIRCGGNFEKAIGNVMGIFRTFPMWNVEELQKARPYYMLGGEILTKQDVATRFRHVWHVLIPNPGLEQIGRDRKLVNNEEEQSDEGSSNINEMRKKKRLRK